MNSRVLSHSRQQDGTKSLYTCLAALLLSVLFAQAMTSIPHLSITFDEDLHISTGYSILRTGDLRLVEDHPPLLGLWMSWPLLLSPDIPDPWDVPAWEQGDRRLFVRNEIWWSLSIDTWVIPPRIPISWLALLMGAFLFRWASDWFGPRAGLVALAFFIFDPNILGHGTLATLDLGSTCLTFITMYGVQRFLRRPSWTNLTVAGIFLGLALATKISTFILLPISAGLIVLWGWNRWRKNLPVRLLIYLSTAFLTLWAAHLFGFDTPIEFPFSLPAPTYWYSFLRVGRHVSSGNKAYLLGETYLGGRWYYFPVVFTLKTPLPMFLLTGWALWTAWQKPRQIWREMTLASLPISYILVSIVNQINLGYRHLLPILPFLYLFIARISSRQTENRVQVNRRIRHLKSAVLILLLIWQAVGTLCAWPFYITFFNEIAGGPRNGYRYLADSNVDWGQGLKALRDYLERQGWPDVQLSSFTFFIPPELYGVKATPLPPLAKAPTILPSRFNPAPGTYVISGSTLRGLQVIDQEMYNWFWHRQPNDVIANAMLVYHVLEQEPKPTWLAQCSVPATPLSPEAAAEAFGRADLRLLTFDCTQSWIHPDTGESPGWYVLHREAVEKEDRFINQQLDQVQLSFEQKIPHEIPPLSIFEWLPRPIAPPESKGPPENAPVRLDGPLTFLGYKVTQGKQMSTLITYWQVTSKPDRPFSLMAHLVSADDRHVSVGDGLGIPWHQLESGDILLQRHSLPLPEDLQAGSYQFQTGAYWLDTMERWPLRNETSPAKDYIVLAELEVSR